ncbi:MAG: DeoR/GlpR family DNA-binding transcription regulator, partial [Chitinophagaceae bacterium]
CLFGINAIDAEHGISDNDWDVVQVKKAMIESAEKVIALTISEKVNTLNRITICDISKVDILITELNPDAPLLEPFRKSGVQVV